MFVKVMGMHVLTRRIKNVVFLKLAQHLEEFKKHRYSTEKEMYFKSINSETVGLEYVQGLPHLTVPLRGRNECCKFVLMPISHNVGNLIAMLRKEDPGIDQASVLNHCGIRIASSCSIQNLLLETFWLRINSTNYKVVPPKSKKLNNLESNGHLNDVRLLIGQLYEVLHVGDYHIKKEAELQDTLENLKYQLELLEIPKASISAYAERRTHKMLWIGLVLMSVQFGAVARLTFWDFSWDIMEPVTYFLSYALEIAMFAYFCLTRKECSLSKLEDREYLSTFYKHAKKQNFNIKLYNSLKKRIAEIEYDLARIRDPLNMQLMPHIVRSQRETIPPALSKVPSKSNTTSTNKILIKTTAY